MQAKELQGWVDRQGSPWAQKIPVLGSALFAGGEGDTEAGPGMLLDCRQGQLYRQLPVFVEKQFNLLPIYKM